MHTIESGFDLKFWSQRPVAFSRGTPSSAAHNVMLRVTYTLPNGKSDILLVTSDQLFLVPSDAGHTLKAASALRPGADQLLVADGTPGPVLSLETGVFSLGVHHVATSLRAATSPEWHLILAKGIVAGDFSLQIGVPSIAEGID